MNEEKLKATVLATLKEVFDPEIPVNVVDLGLIYDIHFPNEQEVQITMTLTNPACPVAGQFPAIIKSHLLSIPGIKSVEVSLIWDPPWTTDRMSEAAKLKLGIF